MADSFVSVLVQAEKFKVRPDQTKLLRELDAKQKRILDFYRESRFLTTREIAEHLGVRPMSDTTGPISSVSAALKLLRQS